MSSTSEGSSKELHLSHTQPHHIGYATKIHRSVIEKDDPKHGAPTNRVFDSNNEALQFTKNKKYT